MDACVYIARSKEGKIYVGSTSDINRRLSQHNSGKGGTYSSKYTEWNLVYKRSCCSLCEARRLERLIKKSATKRKAFYKEAKL